MLGRLRPLSALPHAPYPTGNPDQAAASSAWVVACGRTLTIFWVRE